MLRIAILAGMLWPLCGSALAAGPATQPAAAPAAVVNPWVTTDRSIDTSTVDNILKGLIAKDMSDEQKVLAVFNWVRRLIYHGDGPVQYAYNFHNMIHIFGHGSCLRQTTPMWVLLSRLDYTCRTGAVDGHHIIEVQYGGKWHLFDPHMCFYVYDRSKPANIICIEDIKTDPTLVTAAVKEGRSCPGFMLCGDSATAFSIYSDFKILGDFPESRKYTPVIDEPFGRIALRRGETYTCTWMPGTYWFKANEFHKGRPPSHGCGIKCDSKDTVNLPLYEPHAADHTYRHWGAGYLVYKPDLAGDHWLDGVVARNKNVYPDKAGGVAFLHNKPDNPAEVVFSVNCPYVFTAGELLLTRVGAQDEKSISAAVSGDQGKTWKPLGLKVEDGKVTALFVDEINGTFNGYWLKLTWTGGGVANLELKSHFQLNPYSLPYLVPGKNVVNVAGDRFGSPLKVEWVYAEGPQWKENKTVSETFTKPGQFTVDVKGEKYPRNVSLTLSVGP